MTILRLDRRVVRRVAPALLAGLACLATTSVVQSRSWRKREDPRSALARAIGAKGYHAEGV